MFNRITIALSAVLVFTLMVWGFALAQEHPEHPAEHPEHPADVTPDPLTLDQLSASIKAYVALDSELKGGYFFVMDDVNDEILPLKMVKVHEERLSHIGDDIYFCCADFSTPSGKVYDLDIFMQGTTMADLVPTQITVHKESGVARYNWFEEDGIWITKPVN